MLTLYLTLFPRRQALLHLHAWSSTLNSDFLARRGEGGGRTCNGRRTEQLLAQHAPACCSSLSPPTLLPRPALSVFDSFLTLFAPSWPPHTRVGWPRRHTRCLIACTGQCRCCARASRGSVGGISMQKGESDKREPSPSPLCPRNQTIRTLTVLTSVGVSRSRWSAN